MKNLIVANFREENIKYTQDSLLTLVKTQVANNIELGWLVENIIVVSNRDFEYMGVKTIRIDLNDFCFTGSKVFAVKTLFDNGEKDVVWAHDLDCWGDFLFECPEFKDVGVTQYSRPKVNGGSVFWRYGASDILDEIIAELRNNLEKREEPTLNKIFKKYPDRVTVLNHRYNVGCSGYVPRYERSVKPICGFHFHPTNSIAWETHALDRSGIGQRISARLECLLRKYYPNLPTELSEKGKRRREEKIEARIKQKIKEEKNEKNEKNEKK